MRKMAGKRIVSFILIPLLLVVLIGGTQMVMATLGESSLGDSGGIALFANGAASTFKIPMPKLFTDPTPVLVITTPFAGDITYTGGISSSATQAEKGDNIIELDRLDDGSYSGCSIKVTDAGGTVSTLNLPDFRVEAAQDSSLFPHMRTAGYDYFYGLSDEDLSWLANHHDMIVGGETIRENNYDVYKATNSNVKLIGYISMYTTVEDYIEEWAVEHGYDPEDAFYHYEVDTTEKLFGNKGTLDVPGWSGYGQGGTGATLREARVRGNIGTYSSYCPTQEVYVEAWLDYTLKLVTVNAAEGKYLDGLFIDGMNGCIDPGIFLENTNEMRSLGITTREQVCEYVGSAMVEMRDKMEQYVSAASGKEIMIMGNASETNWALDPANEYASVFAKGYDDLYNEVSIEYFTDPIRIRQEELRRMKMLYDALEDGVVIMAHSDTQYTSRFAPEFDSPDKVVLSEETWNAFHHHILGKMLLVSHPNGYFGYHRGSASYYGKLKDYGIDESHWFANMGYDFGRPVVHDQIDYWGQTGTDRFYQFAKAPYVPGVGTQYEVAAREFENALVLVNFGWDSYTGWRVLGEDRVTHQLPGTYHLLLPDNTVGPPITEITLGRGEGAILIKPEVADYQPTAAAPSSDSSGPDYSGTTKQDENNPPYYIEKPEAQGLKKAAEEAGNAKVSSRLKVPAGIRQDALNSLGGSPYYHDTVKDNAVQVRVTIPQPELAASDLLLSGYVNGARVEQMQAICKRWFQNKIVVVSLLQQGEFGQPVRVAALVDLTGMDTANLRFYTYDRASNTYKQLSGTDYTVDGQGYLHFTTSYGGDILICEGEIQKNQ